MTSLTSLVSYVGINGRVLRVYWGMHIGLNNSLCQYVILCVQPTRKLMFVHNRVSCLK